ncbi:hypothetical protein SELMODRAFT_128840 [Selaginella moellendorffii]|uniref:HD/PDEase domain-containing protein n=1 Tax=Selaginella moellendorffii TaxID=88036 RepID=D8SZV5_SELML|nr:deoxynucleoside triphosphate triphosphohydrolase SAMHD1 homolog [Selaginella moellendorffii]EFJ10092.1 hypothetical protein SELMODRAFT_128840 [Selaginella moellendorffii]|eukprot:XP_002988830.1 deoxynucleoside triphosphate triphosphohydrolase SAMHD1 homolog [Selaginella moellendorffii]
MPLRRNRSDEKDVLDNVHDNIHIDPLAQDFIDTVEFQRLRDVKQLGLCNLVYPGATHSRLEHSLGVYNFARATVFNLDSCWPELELEQSDLTSVGLAGLLHDVGHGPFSHVFENEFLPRIGAGLLKWHHEAMSGKMVDFIVDRNYIDVDAGVLKRVKDMILCSSERGAPQGDKAFLYDIVANGRNGIDVDKFDYILRDTRACGLEPGTFKVCRLMDSMRVIDNEICFRSNVAATICELFVTRGNLFREVYTHPKVKAMELMLADALVMADGFLGISGMVDDPASFWKLDDSLLKAIETSDEPELEASRKLVWRMRRRGRELYQFCDSLKVPAEHAERFSAVTAEDILCYAKGGVLQRDDIVVSNVKIDDACGKSDLLEGVHFFKGYGSTEKLELKAEEVGRSYAGHDVPQRIVRVYVKKYEHLEAACDAFQAFQREKYNVQSQMLRTPDSKRKRKTRRVN